ncbi:NYN domain-containing protein [Pseudorhizobium flavum]|uniref:NYN domain-containing protein n=1 Tax=Pseudorhizobium flavum TaxID=1335061 RepID=UPI003CD0CEAC
MCGDINADGLPSAHGGLSAAVPLRAAVYIDGFNLYHAIADLNAPHLKWVNYRALSERIIRNGESLERVVWCTAVNTKNLAKMLRWREFKKAQEHVGVICAEGHFTEEPRTCHQGHNYLHPTEKEGDVNLAINLISDAHLDRFDVAYLITADSDQVATAKMFRERFPGKTLFSVAPPGRSHSKEIVRHVHGTKAILRDTLDQCIFPGAVIISNGTRVARRPDTYAPSGT